MNNVMNDNNTLSKKDIIVYLIESLKKLNYSSHKIYVYEHYKEFLKKPSISSLEMIDSHAMEYDKQIDENFNIGKRIYTKMKFYKECLKYVFSLLDDKEKEDLLNTLSIENKKYLDAVIYNKFSNNIKKLTKLLIKK